MENLIGLKLRLDQLEDEEKEAKSTAKHIKVEIIIFVIGSLLLAGLSWIVSSAVFYIKSGNNNNHQQGNYQKYQKNNK